MGSSSKAAAVFTREDEDKLWDLGVLGTENPKVLLSTVFFLNGKYFSLCGDEEHRSLRFTQIERKLDPNCYIYTENMSKNRTGSLAQLRVSNKVVPVFAIPEAGTRCRVYILTCIMKRFHLVVCLMSVFIFNHCQRFQKMTRVHDLLVFQLDEIPFPKWLKIFV